ncbi:unnamed protein product [Malus baccata var. baccata]
MVGLAPILFALLLGLPIFAYILVQIFFVALNDHKKPAKNLPPGSMGWPLFGETLGFLKPHCSNTLGSFLQQHCSSYGKVFKSNLFGSPTIVSCDLELNAFILQNEEKLFQASYPKPIHGILGKHSLLTVTGELHRKLRNIGVSFIATSKSSPDFLYWVQKLSISMMESWNGCEQVFFYKQTKAFTLRLMVNHLLSVKPDEPLASRILQDFETYMTGFVSLPLNILGTAYARAVKARARLSFSVKEIMTERRKGKASGQLRGGEEDFLDVILSKQSLTDEEIVSIVLDIMLGGYETTATLMSLIVYFLGHAPIAFHKLKEEHQTIRENKKDGELLNWEDYKKMDFTDYVIYEGMRCGNVVKFVHRKALVDVKFKEFLIPSGWKVLPIFTGAHMDPDLHENPTEFDPWRWINNFKEMSKKVTVFGGGSRLCPGAELAKVVISFFLHHLILSYRWKTKSDDCPLAYPYVQFRRAHENPANNLPLGSMGWPLLGETLGFLKPHSSNSVGTFLQQHCSRYGKVFKSHLFGSPTIVSCDLELNMFILQNEDKLFQASYPKSIHGIVGKHSLLTVSGNLHRKLRSIAVSFISVSKSSPDFLDLVQKLSISMMESWNGCKQVSFFEQAKAFSLGLMVKNLLSVKPEEPLASRILEDFETFMTGFVSLPFNIHGTAYAKAVKARARLSSTVREIMEERRKGNISSNGGLLREREEEDFLDVILSKQNLTDEEIVSIVLDIMLGGYETTATLMSLIVYFLGHAPLAFHKLKEEHQTIRENKRDGEFLTWEDYKKMNFTNYVIYEAMRCGNVVKFVHRKALVDIKFEDCGAEFVIPSGWKVLPIFTGAHLDPDLHEYATEFDPWRWTDNYKEMNKKIIAFGGGVKLCPGSEVAKVVIAFLLHHLVLSYRWKTKPDECPLAYPYVQFRRGLLLEIEPAAAAYQIH